ncbi:MAG TPA: AAA family ATPase, partial [Oscillatoriaceae cyanobacterium]
MRFEALHIERYGAFEQRSLSLGQAPLTVVYGPNEAGKSTTLEAVGDFLFGVPVQTPRMGVYGGDVIRLGASLATSAGGKLTLWRRKGRGRTLTDEAGAAVDEVVLAGLLGGTTRDRFSTLFGLNHDTLRQGGAELLSADGDFGRLIVEAGGGLRGLVSRLDQIDDDLAALFTVRRHSERAFYRATDAFVEAERAAKDASIT